MIDKAKTVKSISTWLTKRVFPYWEATLTGIKENSLAISTGQKIQRLEAMQRAATKNWNKLKELDRSGAPIPRETIVKLIYFAANAEIMLEKLRTQHKPKEIKKPVLDPTDFQPLEPSPDKIDATLRQLLGIDHRD
jgi:hypothetical protein